MTLRSENTRGEHSRSVRFELRADSADNGDGLTLEGYGTTFDDWYDVNDWLGVYRERVARGAFAKTIKDRREQIKVQYDHGYHPLLGSIPIGALQDIREDDHGLYVKVRLHDNWMTEPVRDAIRSGSVSGMSIKFQTVRDEWDYDRDPEERTIKEVRLYEVGPVAFPANEATSVALRSLVERLGDSGRDILNAISTPEVGAASLGTPTLAPPAEAAPTTSLVTRQERRKRGLILRGVTNEQALGGASRQAG